MRAKKFISHYPIADEYRAAEHLRQFIKKAMFETLV